MLDIIPFDLSESEKNEKSSRNRIADSSLVKAIKSKPASLYKSDFSNRIKTGNFEDDFEKIKDADWIIEVIVENLEIKKTVFEKVEKYKSDHAFVTSNTSSIPISLLCEGRSDDFKSKFWA